MGQAYSLARAGRSKVRGPSPRAVALRNAGVSFTSAPIGEPMPAVTPAMRRILIDAAREKGRIKRGGGLERRDLPDIESPITDNDVVDVLELDAALEKLELEDPAKANLVKLSFFAGLSVEESAAILRISRATADRWWTYARAFLRCEMQSSRSSPKQGGLQPHHNMQ